jgi:hypothetical protein
MEGTPILFYENNNDDEAELKDTFKIIAVFIYIYLCFDHEYQYISSIKNTDHLQQSKDYVIIDIAN